MTVNGLTWSDGKFGRSVRRLRRKWADDRRGLHRCFLEFQGRQRNARIPVVFVWKCFGCNTVWYVDSYTWKHAREGYWPAWMKRG